MINREITYERNITGSFIKIAASYQGEFDEKIMLKQKISGLISVEKCFYNGMGQYWYNITGMQTLETRCQVRDVDSRFVRRLLLQICEILQSMELNLLSPEILVLDPEQIYVTNQSQEIRFLIYPGLEDDPIKSMRQLMDFLLLHIDHKDKENVHEIYDIYELVLNDSFTIEDIRTELERKHEQKMQREVEFERNQESDLFIEECVKETEESFSEKKRTFSLSGYLKEKLQDYLPKKLCDFIGKSKGRRGIVEKRSGKESKKDEFIVYPDESEEQEIVAQTTPTICIVSNTNRPEGILRYEGPDHFDDISLDLDEVRIGKGDNVDVRIGNETISRIHAKICVENNTYYIEDLNSTNGTYINGELLSFHAKQVLKINDIVKFAEVTYRFV